MNWEELSDYCNNCNRCALSQTRQHVVLGKGDLSAPILFVGEGPGAKEDEMGIPFVGQAGKLLDLALESIGFEANEYYVANVVKCRPPQNRVPLQEEIDACMPYLREQFKLLRPKIVPRKRGVYCVIGSGVQGFRSKGHVDTAQGYVLYSYLSPGCAFKRREQEACYVAGLKGCKA